MDIICFSDIAWDFMQQRHQHILSRLPNNWKIVFVQPSLIGAILQGKSLASSYPVSKNIRITSMPIIHKMDHNSALRWINDRIMIVWSKLLLRKYGIRNPILLFYEPRFSPVIGRLDESSVWYELIDDRLGFVEVPRWINANIDYVLSKADFITTSSEKLYEMARSTARKKENNIYLVGNGVDLDNFSTIQDKEDKDNANVPTELSGLKNQPIVGYIGSIGEWFDFELIEKVAINFPKLSVAIIGFIFPSQSRQAKFLERLYPNVKFLGKKRYSSLPSYLNMFTSCIIPFKIYELTQAVNPTKFYEYCTAGKPIVTTALPELEKYQDAIYYAHDHKEFLDYLEKSVLKGVNRHTKNRLMEIATENSWEKKVELIKKILSDFQVEKS